MCHEGAAKMVNVTALQSHLDHGDTPGACPAAPTPDPDPPAPDPPAPDPDTDDGSDDDPGDYGCPCSTKNLNKGKVGILHRPPGNPQQ